MAETSCKSDCSNCDLKEMFFTNLESNKLEDLCSKKHEKQYKKGEIIIKEGANIAEFIYLKHGLVKLYRESVNDHEQIIHISKPYDFVSLLSIFSETNYNYSVAALEDSVTCNIDIEFVKQMGRTNGEFAMSVIEKMSKATDNIILSSLEIKQKRLNGRIAYILIFFTEKIYNSMIYDLPMSRKEIADFIGMTTENVIRTLSQFRRDNIIKVYGKTIEVVDMDRLKTICRLS